MLANRVGSCEASCDFTVYVLRALGIPAATDIYHYGPGKGAGHVWNVLRDTTGGYVPFWFIQTKVERGGSDKREKGRYTGGVLEHSRRKYQVSAAIGLFRFR